MHKYTKKQVDWLKKNVSGRGNAELTRMFNKRFGLDLKVSQIKAFKTNRKLSSGLTGWFPPGHVPYNKGKKGVGGWPPTQFKKGNRPPNWVPLGSERITKNGYIQIKIQEGKLQKNWRGKHVLIWEEKHGPLPEGHAIIFGDGNNRNFDVNNLLLVSRKQLVRLNQNKSIQNDAELTKVAIKIVDLQHKISERRKKG